MFSLAVTAPKRCRLGRLETQGDGSNTYACKKYTTTCNTIEYMASFIAYLTCETNGIAHQCTLILWHVCVHADPISHSFLTPRMGIVFSSTVWRTWSTLSIFDDVSRCRKVLRSNSYHRHPLDHRCQFYVYYKWFMVLSSI